MNYLINADILLSVKLTVEKIYYIRLFSWNNEYMVIFFMSAWCFSV
jgi:hypothetical protein